MYNVFLGLLALPVAPGAITTTINNQNKTVSLINGGEINILKTPGLTEIEFEFLLPHTNYPFTIYGSGGIVGQTAIFAYLERLKVTKQPFQFIVSRMSASNKKLMYATNLRVAIEDYAIKEDAEYGLDQMISIKLKQCPKYSTKIIETDDKGQTTVKEQRG